MLFRSLKKIIEIVNIIKNYPNTEYTIPKEYSEILNEFNIKFQTFETKKNPTTLYDNVKYSIKFGNKFFTISINRKNFDRLRNIFEKILFKLTNKKQDNGNHILFAEFNTSRYRDLFKSAFSKKILPVCRRRPLIWNFQTFSTIVKSQCILPQISQNVNTLSNTIVVSIINKNLESLEKSTVFLNS